MRILMTLMMLLGMAGPVLGATTIFPAATNAPNVFFGTNLFKTNSAFQGYVLVGTNILQNQGSTLNGLGFTNSVVSGTLHFIGDTAVSVITGDGNLFYGAPLLAFYFDKDVHAPSFQATNATGGFVGDGSLITGLDAANISGTLSVAQINAGTLVVTNNFGAHWATNFVGQLSPTNYNNGTAASATTWLRGDGTWVRPQGSSNIVDAGYAAIVPDASQILSTNASGTNWLLGTNLFGGPSIANPTIVLSNNTVQFRNSTANGTNIMFIDPVTGALLFNTNGSVRANIGDGVGAGSRSPGNIYTAGAVNTASTITSGGALIAASSSYLNWNTRTRMYAPANGSLRVTDDGGTKDSMYINSAVRLLSDGASNAVFGITSTTNHWVGGTFDYSIFCSDATDHQVLSGIVTFADANKAGVWYSNITEVAANRAFAETSGASTLAATWGISPDPQYPTNRVIIHLTPDTSLTPVAAHFYVKWQLRNANTNAVSTVW